MESSQPPVLEALKAHERWLMRRVLEYAKASDYTRYTSTLEEAWRASIEGLSSAIDGCWRSTGGVARPVESDLEADGFDAFGVKEARLHRQRGIALHMFMGLLKYYRQSYLDLVAERAAGEQDRARAHRFVQAFFDRLEVVICAESESWTKEAFESEVLATNRKLANEKNRYLTIFESLPGAAFFVGPEGKIANMNWAAAELFAGAQNPGTTYYGTAEVSAMPWLERAVEDLQRTGSTVLSVEVDVVTARGLRRVSVSARRMLDVSEKFAGVLVFAEDLTERRALEDRLHMAERLASRGLAAELTNALNNPLACVLANVELLEDVHRRAAEQGQPADGPSAEALRDARMGAERIAAVVRDVERALAAERGEARTPIPRGAPEVAGDRPLPSLLFRA